MADGRTQLQPGRIVVALLKTPAYGSRSDEVAGLQRDYLSATPRYPDLVTRENARSHSPVLSRLCADCWTGQKTTVVVPTLTAYPSSAKESPV